MPIILPAFLFQMSVVPDLEKLKWQNRVLVVFASNETDAQLKRQEELIEEQQRGFEERDTKVYRVIDSMPDANRLRSKLGVENHSFAVVLIGKDGSVKMRKFEPLQPDKLFETIDRMPMRRHEMQKQ